MKIFIGLVLALIIQKEAFAQSALQTSSSRDTAFAVQKTVDYLNDISFNMYLSAPDSARAIAEKALLLAKKIEYKGIQTQIKGPPTTLVPLLIVRRRHYPIISLILNRRRG